MLVLSRQRDETIMIGDDIEITIVDIRGDKVRLGISAPTRIAVHRKEVYEAIKAENQRAAQIAGGDIASARGIPGVIRPRIAGARVGAISGSVNPLPIRPGVGGIRGAGTAPPGAAHA